MVDFNLGSCKTDRLPNRQIFRLYGTLYNGTIVNPEMFVVEMFFVVQKCYEIKKNHEIYAYIEHVE